MNFSTLNQNEKLAVYGAVASIVGPLLSSMGFGFGVGWLTLLLAVAMLAVVFLPQLSPQTTLPGSKGSLMLVVGGIAAVSAALALISSIGFLGFFGSNIIFVLGWLLGIVGGLLMGWAGWKEFQAEGGKFQLGASAAAPASRPDRDVPPAAPAASAERDVPPAPPASDTERDFPPPARSNAPGTDDEERRTDI